MSDLRDRLMAIHHPVKEEVERYHRDDDLPGPCPTPDQRWPADPCPGHTMTEKVCAECGYSHDGESPVFRIWPCPTIKALDEATR